MAELYNFRDLLQESSYWVEVEPIQIDSSPILNTLKSDQENPKIFPASSALDAFFKMLPIQCLGDLVDATNQNYLRNSESVSNIKQKKWKNLELWDLTKFIGMIMYMGIIRLPSIEEHWISNYCSSIVKDIMDFSRFEQISRFLKASYLAEASDFHKINIIKNELKKSCKIYSPSRYHYSIDESMVAFNGRHKWKQYMPAKPNKWGFKVFLLCDAAQGFVENFEFYKGGKKYTPYNISMRLLKDMQNIHVTGDNWYASVKLMTDLLEKDIKSTFTIKISAPGLPEEIRNLTTHTKKKVGEFWVNDQFSFEMFKGKANYGCLSTLCREPKLIADRGPKKGVRSELVAFYNKTMKGVDEFDQYISYYKTKHRSVKWWKYCFFYLLDMAAFNSFVIYKNAQNLKINYKKYRILLAEALCSFCPVEEIKEITSSQIDLKGESRKGGEKREEIFFIEQSASHCTCGIKHMMEKIERTGRKKCFFCEKEKKYSTASWECNVCKVALHEKCFHLYHKAFVGDQQSF